MLKRVEARVYLATRDRSVMLVINGIDVAKAETVNELRCAGWTVNGTTFVDACGMYLNAWRVPEIRHRVDLKIGDREYAGSRLWLTVSEAEAYAQGRRDADEIAGVTDAEYVVARVGVIIGSLTTLTVAV